MKKKYLQAGISTFAIMLFGITIVFYMFGYTNVFDTYSETPLTIETEYDETEEELQEKTSKQIDDPTLFSGDYFGTIGNLILAGLGAFGVSIIGVGILIRIFLGGQATSTYIHFIFPVVLLIILNIFIFPLSTITDQTQQLNIGNMQTTVFLIVFFNLWFILGVIEFIRGGHT